MEVSVLFDQFRQCSKESFYKKSGQHSGDSGLPYEDESMPLFAEIRYQAQVDISTVLCDECYMI